MPVHSRSALIRHIKEIQLAGKDYDVKDTALAEQGRHRIEWAAQEMPVVS